MRIVAGIVLTVCAAASASPAAAQTAARYVALALSPDEGEPPLACATPSVFARQLRSGFAPPGAMRMADAETADGRPLWYDQNPRLLRADHVGGLSFDDFLVAGDVATLSFERRSSRADDTVRETWRRVGTTAVDGRLVSVFNPTWNDADLWDTVGPYRRGFDRPRVYFGELTLPEADAAAAADDDDGDEDEPFHVWLNVTPLNVPPAEVRRIDAGAQYASHVVNLVIPDFGDGRLSDWRYGQDLRSAARRFYRYFRDEYDSIAFVSRQHQVTPYGAFHRNVRNQIRGLGDLAVFDNTQYYGSDGVLRSVEFYRDAAFAQTATSTHEIGHQWADYWNWPALSGGVERAGHQPEAHTPLLYPGEVYLGAVLQVTRRVGADDSGGAAFAIERTPEPALLHPTTLYRMGLLETAAVPDLLVFENQGQFTETDSSAAPDTGTAVEGGARPVHVNDVLAEHGLRTGPVDGSWSRVTVVVSRDGLLSREEMSYWNFFAARHAAAGGVTSWEGVPSFFEATGGAVPLRTDVTPRSHAKVRQEIETAPPSMDPGELRGVRLDEPLPTSVAAGETVTIAGTVTAADRDDFDGACVRWSRYGASADDRIFECARISGNRRFSAPHTFTNGEAGRYALQFFLFYPDSGPQYPRANVSTITVTGDGRNRPPRPFGSVPAQTLTAGGPAAAVDAAPWFRDPDGDRLRYSAASEDDVVVTAGVTGSTVRLTPGAGAGTTRVTVTARDPGGLSADQRIPVTVEARAPRWSRGGVGAALLDLPTTITHVRIEGEHTGRAENFVVWCGRTWDDIGGLLVNEILGTGRVASSTRYSGVHSALRDYNRRGDPCRTLEIRYSSGVRWTITETSSGSGLSPSAGTGSLAGDRAAERRATDRRRR